MKKLFLLLIVILICFSSSCQKEKTESEIVEEDTTEEVLEDLLSLEKLYSNIDQYEDEFYVDLGITDTKLLERSEMGKSTKENYDECFGEKVVSCIIGKSLDEVFDGCFIAVEFESYQDAESAYQTLGGNDLIIYKGLYTLYKNLILIDHYAAYYLTGDYDTDLVNDYKITNEDNILLSTLKLPTNYNIPTGIKRIAGFSMELSGVKKVILNEELEEIGMFAFSFDVEEVVFNKNLKTIRLGSFLACENLKYVVLPKTIKKIEYAAFATGNIYCEVSTKPVGWEDEFCIGDAVVYWAGEWEYDENGIPYPLISKDNGNLI